LVPIAKNHLKDLFGDAIAAGLTGVKFILAQIIISIDIQTVKVLFSI